MNKNTFSNRVTWYNLYSVFCCLDSCTEYGSVYRSGNDRGKVRCLIRLSRRSFRISQWSVWQDFFCVPDTCFTELFLGESAGKI